MVKLGTGRAGVFDSNAEAGRAGLASKQTGLVPSWRDSLAVADRDSPLFMRLSQRRRSTWTPGAIAGGLAETASLPIDFQYLLALAGAVYVGSWAVGNGSLEKK